MRASGYIETPFIYRHVKGKPSSAYKGFNTAEEYRASRGIAMEIAAILSDAGFTVVGPAGSVALARSGCEAAVLDINLGKETAEPIARVLSVRATPFVTISGYSREQQPAAFRHAPLVSKPVRPELFVAEIRKCLSPRLPCMGLFLSRGLLRFRLILLSFLHFLTSEVLSLVQPRRRLSSVPTAIPERRRAQGLSRSAGTQPLTLARCFQAAPLQPRARGQACAIGRRNRIAPP